MNKKLLLVFLGIVFLGIGGLVGYSIGMNSNKSAVSSPSTPNTSSDEPQIIDEGGLVTLEGTIGCLKHAGNPEITTMECAIGLIMADGTQYALYSDDPTVTGSVPSGQTVEVTGSLQEKTSDTYKEAGLIKVGSIRQK